MGLPSFLGGKPKKTPAPGAAPDAPVSLLAPPPAAPTNIAATSGGFFATNAARRARTMAGAGVSLAKMAPSLTKPTPKKLFNAGKALFRGLF